MTPEPHGPLFNRELSWLEFNARVLAEAQSPDVPLLERVKFLGITASNLDEFLMVRVGALHELISEGIRERSVDGRTPKQQLKAIRARVRLLLEAMYETEATLSQRLTKRGLRIESARSLSKRQRAELADEFQRRIAPVLTPLAFDPGHPFPFITSGSLNLGVMLSIGKNTHAAIMKVPRLIPRFIAIPDMRHGYLPIEELIQLHIGSFFPGLEVREVVPFRVMRNADISLREDEVEDLLESVESELRRREKREVVWMEIAGGAGDELTELLMREMEIARDDLFIAPGPVRLADLTEIYANVDLPSLKDAAFTPRMPRAVAGSDDIFSLVRQGDVLLHRPYDSYSATIEFIETAADDADVIAIKQTLYRTDPGSAVVDALARAAGRGKQVTAVVELQARFDEERNIAWARRLEEAGVQVVYGLVGIKTHAKVCLVIRREGDELRRYVHFSTGNYNARTAAIYTDLDLLTADAAIGDDAAQLMNFLTGYSTETAQEMFAQRAPKFHWKRLVIAPTDYHAWVLKMIARETRNALEKKPAQIIAKMNALVEPAIIDALYEAAGAGVRIELIVRGVCCLVPRPNIRVTSIVDRFLEHTRVISLANGGDREVWLTSGDWMPRNFFRRVEVTWPVTAPDLRARLENEILATCLADDVKAWRLQPDGTYRRRKPGSVPLRSQERFIEIARGESPVALPLPVKKRRGRVAKKK